MRAVRAIEVGAEPGSAVLDALAAALDGRGPLLVPHAPGETPPPHPGRTDLAGVVAVGTSGSTGTPKLAALSAGALRASAAGTHEVLGGPGRWLLALPGHHVAGLQVVLRGLAAGYAPVAYGPGRFDAAGFAAACARLDGPRRYTSLVPTQLRRVLADPAATAALAGLDGVLVGGAATAPDVLDAARAAGARVLTTYGMSETAGGCVYDGTPLPGVRVRVLGADAGPRAGRIVLGGPTLAEGYLRRPAADEPLAEPASGPARGSELVTGSGAGLVTAINAGVGAGPCDGPAPGSDIVTDVDGGPNGANAALPATVAGSDFVTGPDGSRWFVTGDLGELVGGHLDVLGRADDVIVTGGVKIAPRVVETALRDVLPPGCDVVVLPVPDPEWGQCVGLALAPGDGDVIAARRAWPAARTRLRTLLPPAALPRRVAVVDRIPLLGIGKPDRAALTRLLQEVDAGA